MFGEENRKWNDTALQKLYEKHEKDVKKYKEAKKRAGNDAGKLLKIMLEMDKRKFMQHKRNQVSKYEWKK